MTFFLLGPEQRESTTERRGRVTPPTRTEDLYLGYDTSRGRVDLDRKQLRGTGMGVGSRPSLSGPQVLLLSTFPPGRLGGSRHRLVSETRVVAEGLIPPLEGGEGPFIQFLYPVTGVRPGWSGEDRVSDRGRRRQEGGGSGRGTDGERW